MSKRYATAMSSLALLLLASCDNASDKAKPAPPLAPTMPQPASTVVPPPPAAAPVSKDTMEKPPGLDPAKLAGHAKALEELGYHEEAAKLYGHACNWGYTPACAHIKGQDTQVAMPKNQVPAKPQIDHASAKPAIAAGTKPAKPAAIAPMAAKAPPLSTRPATPPATPPAAPSQVSVMAPPVPATPVTAPVRSSSAPAPTPIVQASIKPPTAPAIHETPSTGDTHKLSQHANELEKIGYVPEAVTLYKDACLAGDGASCKRVGEIYIKGIDGVQRDYAESVRWYGRARKLGLTVPALEKRSLYR
jgi:TPR repeat protein